MRRVFFLAGIWGWSFLFVRVAVKGLTPTTVACGRVLLGSAFLFIALAIRGRRVQIDRRLVKTVATMGLLSNAVPFALQAWAQHQPSMTSSLASVLNATTPIFAAVVAAVMSGDRFRRPQLGGLLLSIVGVGVAAGLSRGDLRAATILPDLAMLGSTFSYGLGFTYARIHLGPIDPMIAAAGQQIMAFGFLLPFATITSMQHGIHLTTTRVIAMLLLGCLGTGLAWMINLGNITLLGPTKASTVTFLVPIVAVIAGVVILHEPFRVTMVIGAAIVLLGVALIQERITARRIAVPSEADPVFLER